MAIYFNKNGEQKEIATYESCISNISVSDPSSWGNTYTSSNGSLKLTVQANPTDAVRNETVTISYSAGDTSCTKTLDISQEAGEPTPVEAVFTYCNGTTAYTESLGEGSTAITLCVTSTRGEERLAYTVDSTCNWITTQTTSTGFRLIVAANTGAYRQCAFYATQTETGKKLLISLSQAASTAGQFTYCDGTTAKTITTDAEAKNFRYCVVSKIGGVAGQPYQRVGQVCDWVSVTTAGTYFNVVLTQNTTSSERTCEVTLKQTNSDAYIQFIITQSTSNCNEFLDSCCGKGSYSHPDYDIGMHYEQGYTNGDSIKYNSTIHLTNTPPSWLGVTIQNGVILYTVLEENTGTYREANLEYALDSTQGTNVCPTAEVLVRQDANPSLLMDIRAVIVNGGGSAVTVASIKWNFANGQVVYTRVSEEVPAGGSIVQTCKFLKTLNNQELYVGHPVDLTLSDGTVKTPRIDKLLIESGKQYVIDFT